MLQETCRSCPFVPSSVRPIVAAAFLPAAILGPNPLAMPLEPGTTLGPYAVTAKIGEGGMGEVWSTSQVVPAGLQETQHRSFRQQRAY